MLSVDKTVGGVVVSVSWFKILIWLSAGIFNVGCIQGSAFGIQIFRIVESGYLLSCINRFFKYIVYNRVQRLLDAFDALGLGDVNSAESAAV